MNLKCKKIICIGFILTIMTSLCACGDEIPELTEEQTEVITEYSAALLLKYDSDTPSRLLPKDETNVIMVELPGETHQNVAPAKPDISEEAPEMTSDDITVNDVTAPEENKVGQGEGFVPFVKDAGISISYSGQYEVTDSYPDGDDANAYFAVDASAGKKLLVVHFTITNTLNTDNEVNMNQYALKYRISINGGENERVMTTMLANDILSYVGTIPAGGSVDVVAVAEPSQEVSETVNSLVLSIRGEDYSTTMQLQ